MGYREAQSLGMGSDGHSTTDTKLVRSNLLRGSQEEGCSSIIPPPNITQKNRLAAHATKPQGSYSGQQ